MDYLNLDKKLDQLNLAWQEYDFGDTLWANISKDLLSEKTGLTNNCETTKYTIKFQSDNQVLIFKETAQISLIKKILTILWGINSAVSTQELKSCRQENELEQPNKY